MITTSFLMVVLFFGGWHFPWLADVGGDWHGSEYVIRIVIIGGKVTLFILFFMLIRWTIPRFRFDQLMGLAWKVLIPLSLLNLVRRDDRAAVPTCRRGCCCRRRLDY